MRLFESFKKALRLAPSERLPNFFIAGAARCGTTSMWQYLRQHPDIYMTPVLGFKEPSYYCDIYGMKDRQSYLALFKDAGTRKMIGEASGPYLTSPESPELIQKEVPDPRFIIMLRNPVERAFSLYKWMQENKYEKTPTFEKALQAEDECRFNNPEFIKNNGQYYYNFLYFHSGLYFEQVRRFYSTFGPNRVLVILFEEFAKDTAGAVRSAYSFLGVDPGFKPELEVHNATLRSIKLDPCTRANLSDRYAPDIERLGQLLGRADLKSIWS